MRVLSTGIWVLQPLSKAYSGEQWKAVGSRVWVGIISDEC